MARTGFSANLSEASTVTAFIKLSLFERIQMHILQTESFSIQLFSFLKCVKKQPGYSYCVDIITVVINFLTFLLLTMN